MPDNSQSIAPMHIGTSLAAWARFRDRFASYREAIPVTEAIRQAATIPGIEGVDVSRGYMPEDIRPVKEVLQEVNLQVSAVGTALSKDPRTVPGISLEQNRDGIEDYEYVVMLRRLPGDKPKELAARCEQFHKELVGPRTDFSAIDKLRDLRREVVRMLEKTQP